MNAETSPSLAVRLGPLTLRNPVMVASGTFGYGPEYAELVDLAALGAIVVKGICLQPTRGNPPPRTVETPSGLINAIGLPGPGVEGFLRDYLPFLRRVPTPVIVNVWGHTVDEYGEVVSALDRAEGIHAYEINVSCPNVKEGSRAFGVHLDMFRRVLDRVRAATRRPVIPKLAPNVSDIAAFARAAEECGADAISLINSIPAMAVDIETRRPILGNVTGGLTGPAIHPIAVKLVWEAAQAVRIPTIAMGGIRDAADAIEFLIVGASAVAVGTANFTEPRTALNVVQGIREYLVRHRLRSVAELTGSLRLEGPPCGV
ncbi:MAG: dihydroorotate dehydrogenase [Kiritimatiellae bacterium]|nr:dihydroorotate dehydrogenase [Kiritimatiellia bacterium]